MGVEKRILVVEDELGFAKMVKLRLESIGYAVTIAGDAYTGTQEIIKNEFNLIVLDLMMPAGGGFSLLERIRKIPTKADIPVVILTTSKAEEDILKTYDNHANCYVTKPVNMEQFIRVVQYIEDFWFTIVRLPTK